MHSLKKLFQFVRPFLRKLLVAVLLTGLLTVIGMAPPILMRRLINDVARQEQWGIFPLIIGLLLAVPLIRALVNILNSLVLNRISLGIIEKTRKQIFSHLMRLSLKFYSQTPVGSITQRLLADVAAVSQVITGGIITLITDLIAVLIALVIMARLDLRLTALTLVLLPLYYLNYRFFAKRIKSANTVLRTNMDHISSTLQERLSAHELIQSYGQSEEGSTHFTSQAKQIMNASIKGANYNIAFSQMSVFINKLGNTLIYCAGCYYFVQGELDYGGVIAFCAYATQLLGPVVRFSTVASQITQVGVSVDRINEILDREPAIKDLPDADPVEELKGGIRFRGVRFAYEGESGEALEDVNLTIPPGTHLALVGPTGAGRTTLAMLLRRLYEPEQGSIEVDGKDIRRYRLQDYRGSVALVPAECAIFDGTIRENLCYGRPDAAREEMIEAARAVGLHDFVGSLSEQYETRLGTGGLRLSTGARQRIGIGRALIARPLVLIIDEATAALDPESAEDVNQAVRRSMGGKTCIIVVHRVLMAKLLDAIAVMENGKVIDEGEHEELITKPDSLYRLIFAKQYGEDRLPPAKEAHDHGSS